MNKKTQKIENLPIALVLRFQIYRAPKNEGSYKFRQQCDNLFSSIYSNITVDNFFNNYFNKDFIDEKDFKKNKGVGPKIFNFICEQLRFIEITYFSQRNYPAYLADLILEEVGEVRHKIKYDVEQRLDYIEKQLTSIYSLLKSLQNNTSTYAPDYDDDDNDDDYVADTLS